MWRVLGLVSACSFSAQLVEPTSDAPPLSPDAQSATQPCRVQASGAAIAVGVLGGDAGSMQPDLACASGELPIGFQFDLSQGNVTVFEPAVVAVHVRCATITRDTSGRATSLPSKMVSDSGDHTLCIGWGTHDGDELWCPTGQVIVGISGNEAASSLYNTVAIECAPLGGGATTTITYGNTGSFSNQPQHPACPPGSAVASFGVQSSCGQDELIVKCAPVGCT
jgi:hypothetical protein